MKQQQMLLLQKTIGFTPCRSEGKASRHKQKSLLVGRDNQFRQFVWSGFSVQPDTFTCLFSKERDLKRAQNTDKKGEVERYGFWLVFFRIVWISLGTKTLLDGVQG
jgi:hypothetical protein